MATVNKVLGVARGFLGKNEKDGSFKEIIDIYNSHKPLARNIKMKYSWEWCATCISAIFIKADAVSLLGGTECGVQRFIDIFKKKGIWEENGRITPKPGYIICYNWDDRTQPNTGWADHIGIVERVSNGRITIIEGNYGEKVARRNIPVGWGYIRGYAKPKYSVSKKSTDTIAREVINGKWGNGSERKRKLSAAGYDYHKIQERVNEMLSK